MADFAGLGGVKITGFISPTDTNDTYAVIDPLYGIDGLRNVDLLVDLDSIPELRRRAGMIVGVSGGTDYYRLLEAGTGWTFTITDWQELNFDGATALSALTDTNITSVSDGNILIYSGGSWVNVEEKDIYFTATGASQTIFSVLTFPPIDVAQTKLYVNGLKQRYGAPYDYIITGGTDIVWVSTKHSIDTDDELDIIYI